MRPDPRSTVDLFAAALALDFEDDPRWSLVGALQRRATAEVFEAAADRCRGPDPRGRLLGVDVLGQLGIETRPFHERALPLLISLLDDPDDAVAGAAGIALGHHSDLRAVDALVATAAHPSAEVRRGVVHGLLALDDARAIEALVRLSRDADDAVRDWATFGLGTQIERDTPEIREALFDRLDDADPDTRGEALVGLARRGDPRGVAPLREALAAGPPGTLLLEAAALSLRSELPERS